MALHEELLILIPWLKAHPEATVPEVAAHFGRTETEIKQFIMMLCISGPGDEPGQMLDITYDGDRIYVYDTLGVDRPFRFDASEAMCLQAGLDALKEVPSSLVGFTLDDVHSAEAKLAALLGSRVPFDFVDGSETSADGALELISEALTSGRQLAFEYWNIARDDVSARRVSPLRLRIVNDEQVLDAYCHTSEGWRSFRIARMLDLAVCDQAHSVPAVDFEPMAGEIALISVPQHRSHLLEPFDLLSQGESPDGRIYARVRVVEPLFLARRHVASGFDLEVLEPAEFVAVVEKFRSAAVSAYLDR